MCGIAGIITAGGAASDGSIHRALQAMTDAQRHRGPDDSGHYTDRPGETVVALGHRRLSILDVSAEGHQPMVDPETGSVLVYNGEIYNYRALRAELEREGCRFRGHSDTEVVLFALTRWGPESLERLCGMYALALYEPHRRRLLLARDPLGIKPLYVARIGPATLFASEVRTLLASGMVPRRVDRRAVAGFLAYGAVQEPDTIVEDVESFPAGVSQWIDVTTSPPTPASIERHWTMPEPTTMTESDAVERYRAALDVAVHEHLESDVPLAVLLSSGLDSTVIAGLAARHASDVRTFTVGFSDDADLDESPLAEETARLIGARHTTASITATECEPLVERWATSLDQPSMDGLNVYLISKVIAEHDITVVLSGTGGDELFGGYPSFRDVPRMMRFLRPIRWLPSRVRSAAAHFAATGRSEAVRQKLTDMMTSDGDVLSLCLLRRRTMSDRQLADLGVHAAEQRLHPLFVPGAAVDRVTRRPNDPLWMVSQLESQFYQGNVLLRDGDSNGMAHSLEIRVPFLDRRVIDLAFALPDHVKLPNGRPDKHLTRKAFGDLMRPALTEQRKRTFALPIKRWMRGPLAPLCEAGLDRLRESGLVQQQGVTNVWRAYESAPESPIWSRAWSMCVLGVYLMQNELEA